MRRERAQGPMLTLVTVAALLLVGCGSREGSDATAGWSAAYGHVHSLGVNPADDRLYVASHTGVFRLEESGFRRIADRYQDTMAFAVAGPDHFLASGHPDLREDEHPLLGLIESRDAAESWRSVSLDGEADFHALEVVGDDIYGLDSQSGRLMRSPDGSEWTTLGRVLALDLAVDPRGSGVVLLTDPQGNLIRVDARNAGATPRRQTGAPAMVVVDWRGDTVAGVGAHGEVHVSDDRGATWQATGRLPRPPEALTLAEDRWYAAVEGAVLASQDRGRTWKDVTASSA